MDLLFTRADGFLTGLLTSNFVGMSIRFDLEKSD